MNKIIFILSFFLIVLLWEFFDGDGSYREYTQLQNHVSNLEIENTVVINDKGLLKSKTFMLTGKLNGVSRAEAKSLIEKNSGKIISNVNKKLDYLISGKKANIKKINIPKELNIKIIDQRELMEMLNKTG